MTAAPVDAVIVGGGHNGLVTAFYLARAGKRVLVLEARDRIGGAVSTDELVPGYRFSVCAHVLRYLQPAVIRDMGLAGRVRVHRLSPYRVNLYPDGSSWTQWPDGRRTVESLERFAPGSSRGLAAWEAFWARAAKLYAPYWLSDPPADDDLRARSAELGEPDLYDRLREQDMASFVRAHFDDERVQGAFIGGAGDPRAPGSMLEAAWGAVAFDPEWVGLPEGGMGALADALAGAAAAAGATIRTGTRVTRVLVDGGAAVGVETADGETIRAEIVASNLGPKPTFLELVEPGALDAGFRARVDALSMTVAWVKAHFGLREPLRLDRYLGTGHDPRAAAYVRMCPSIDVMTRSWDEAAAGRPAAEPVIQLGSLSVHDPASAPAGGHAVSALTFYAPPRPAGASWDDLRDGVAEALIDQIDGYIPNFRRGLAGHILLTPLDLERRYGMVDGNIDHGDHVPGQFFTGRPFEGSGGWRTPIRGLFCCGAGTHPGGEVSGAPGYNAAHAILAHDRAVAGGSG